jgi:hypothetical protein
MAVLEVGAVSLQGLGVSKARRAVTGSDAHLGVHHRGRGFGNHAWAEYGLSRDPRGLTGARCGAGGCGGVLFLLYLAWDAWRTPTQSSAAASDMPASFGRGLLTNLLNPKAAMFYVTVLPRFIDPAQAVLPQNLLLTALHVGVVIVIHTGIVLFAAQSRRLFDNPAREQRVRRGLAIVLALVAVWFLFETA